MHWTYSTLLLISLASHIAAQNGCYYPHGSLSSDIPCDSTAQVSMCCGSRSSCLSSGLCLLDSTSETRGISYARGICTDPARKSPFCPRHCQLSQETALGNTSAYDFRTGGVQGWECIGEGYAEPTAYRCESVSEKPRCCQTPAAVFSPPGATIGNARTVQMFPASGEGRSSTSSLCSNGGTGTTWTSSPSPPSEATGNPVTAGGGESVADDGKFGRRVGGRWRPSHEATLGVAITVPLVITGLVAVLLFLWHRKRRAAREVPTPATDNRPEGWHTAEPDSNGVSMAFPLPNRTQAMK